MAPQIDLVLSGPICGPQQTAYRGEIRAFVEAVEVVPGDLLIWTDNLNVKRTWNRISQGELIRGSHEDLWRRAARAKRGRSIQVEWIKSHMTADEAVRRGWTAECWSRLLGPASDSASQRPSAGGMPLPT